MSKDLKDIINTVEKESKSNAELEQKILSLEEETNRQKFTIKEQKVLIENLQNHIKNEEIDNVELPSEIDILKEIIISQRRESDKKTIIIEQLNDKIFELTSGLDGGENLYAQHIKSEEFLETQKLLVQLTDENEKYKKKIELLEAQIEELQSEKSNFEDYIEDDTVTEITEELINFKRLNFQLMEENGLLRVEVESLKAKLNDRIEIAGSEELVLANDKISILTSEIEDLESKIKYLQEKIDNTDEPIVVSTEDALEFAKLRDEFDNAKTKILKVQKENQNLRQIINELKEEKIIVRQGTDIKLPKVNSLSKRMRQSLFFRMYSLLDDLNKVNVINYLIQDLKSGNYQVKRNAIKILSVLKNKRIYDTFLQMLNDKDWIIRYSIIKALSKFEDKNNELKKIFQRFSSDIDVDVRELALKILEDFSN